MKRRYVLKNKPKLKIKELSTLFKMLSDSQEFNEFLNDYNRIYKGFEKDNLFSVFEKEFKELIPLLVDSPKHTKREIKNQLRYCWFQVMFLPKTRFEVFKYRKRKDDKGTVVAAPLSNPSVKFPSEEIVAERLIEGIQVRDIKDNFSYAILPYSLNFRLKKKPNDPLLQNPFFRWHFIFKPLLSKKLNGKLFSDTFELYEYFNDEVKLFELFTRLIRMSVWGTIKPMVVRKFKKRPWDSASDFEKNIKEDIKVLNYGKEIREVKRPNEPKFNEKKVFLQKWLYTKKKEYRKLIMQILKEDHTRKEKERQEAEVQKMREEE